MSSTIAASCRGLPRAHEAGPLPGGDRPGELGVDRALAGAEPVEDVAGEQLGVGVAQAVDERQPPDPVRGLDDGARRARRGRPPRPAAAGSTASSSRVTSAANTDCASGQ